MRSLHEDEVSYLTVPTWEPRATVAHGFFTRAGGVSPPPFASLNVGPKGTDSPVHVRENLRRVAQSLAIPLERIFCLSQVHGARILEVSDCKGSVFGAEEPLQGDGLVTAEKGLYLGILTADCVPLLFLDPNRSAVGAVHAGWRSTLRGIAGEAVRKMGDAFGCRAEDLLVALGPAIGPCCYLVGNEVAQAFRNADQAAERFLYPAGTDQWKMNLQGINRHQLMSEGIQEDNVVRLSDCTCCRRDRFFSVRAQGEPTGRQISLIGLRPESGKRDAGVG